MEMVSGKQRSARAPLEIDSANISDISLTFVRGADLSGRILIEGREALDFSDVRVWLSESDQFFGGGKGAVIKSDGTLTIENVSEGNYQVQAGGRPPAYSPDFFLKAARANGEDVLEKGLSIGAGSTRGALEIVLSSAGARIEGTVTDDNDLPSAGAVVAVVPEEPRRKQFRSYKNTTTDQYGKFVIRGIAPGKYKLFSWKDVESDSWQDPDFLKPFENQGTEITAEENGHLSLTLKVIPTDKPKN
jgi:hypothetical protein